MSTPTDTNPELLTVIATVRAKARRTAGPARPRAAGRRAI